MCIESIRGWGPVAARMRNSRGVGQIARLAIAALVLSVASLFPAASPALADELLENEEPLAYRAAWPPLPERAPRLGPDLTHGYHAHAHIATPDERWIDVDLSEQRVVAYEGTRPVRSFIVSTGRPGRQTREGAFRIWTKTRIQDMDSDDPAADDYYFLPDVEWVQYFDGEIAFHAAYWHDDFGTPVSSGCINMRPEEARWLFEWAGPWYDMDGPAWQAPSAGEPGTLVVVHE